MNAPPFIAASALLATALGAAEPESPFGVIESYEIYLQPTDEVVNLLERPAREAEWHFHGLSLQAIDRVLAEAGLNPATHPELSSDKWLGSGDYVVLLPSKETIMFLTPEARRTLCRVLSRFEENYYQRHPVVFEGGDIRGWFKGAGLKEELLEVIERLSWPDGPDRFLTDVPFLLGWAENATEEQAILRAISRRKTTVARLRLKPESDLETITNYWSAGAKAKDVLPLLEAVDRNPNVDQIDLAHLLPPTPRKHLNLYPTLQDGRGGRFPDAWWTAVNFLNFFPIALYGDSMNLNAQIRSRFRPMDPNESFQFGDLVFVIRSEDNLAIHACVYLADNLVYTKNGAGVFEPWVIQSMSDMLAHHRHGDSLKVSGWRDQSVPATLIPRPAPNTGFGNSNGINVILP